MYQSQYRLLFFMARQPSVQVMVDQKQVVNVEHFSYLSNMITNNARCTLEIECRIAMVQPALNKKKTLFRSDLYLRKKFLQCYIWYRNLGTSGRSSEIP